ncbi:MAG: hypothetical protein IJX89_01640 [Alphaproteobacteria bacterium]|nr:hypothetical protein [Alphaproteobacteria bacterium]
MAKTVFPDSKIQHTLYHYTTRENADNILKNGFKVASAVKGEGRFTDNFDGVFFTQSNKSYWNNEGLEQIAVRVNLQNPLDISSFPMDEAQYTPEQRQIADKIGHIMQIAEENHDKIMGDKYSQVVMAQQATRAFQAAGYDGLIYNSSDGHVEHVVFDPKNIQIIGTNIERFNSADKKLKQKMIMAEQLRQQVFDK